MHHPIAMSIIQINRILFDVELAYTFPLFIYDEHLMLFTCVQVERSIYF